MNVLVVPTIRENCIKPFLEAWCDVEIWDRIIVVEDNPEKSFNIRPGCQHYSWKEISEDLEDDAWIISRRDCAIKCYGILQAYRTNAEYIYVLDDDCYPLPEEDFQQVHRRNLEQTPKWTESVLDKRTRGLPYFNKGVLSNVMFSVGLWKGVADFDAVTCMTIGLDHNFCPPDNTRVIPNGQYFPFCGMNFACRREVAPLCYFPLMGMNSPYGRFDDIWFGVTAKKICDHLGYYITCGHPFIRHEKASNILSNLIKEAPGIKMHETFWEKIDKIELKETTTTGCMAEVGYALKQEEDEYLRKVGLAIEVWTRQFTS